MGRKKKSFINRQTALTYELVHRPQEEVDEQNPEAQNGGVFVLRNSGNYTRITDVNLGQKEHAQTGAKSEAPVVVDPAQLPGIKSSFFSEKYENLEEEFGPYDPKEYEFGEFGFSNDGYDYGQHMREIGGGGPDHGVFVPAVGMAQVSYDEQLEKDEILKMKQLQNDRRKNAELDEVMAMLESDIEDAVGEDDSDGDVEINTNDEVSVGSSSMGKFPDDFITVAGHNRDRSIGTSTEPALQESALPSETPSGHRERVARFVDEQFDHFLEHYDDDEDEDDEKSGQAQEDKEDSQDDSTTEGPSRDNVCQDEVLMQAMDEFLKKMERCQLREEHDSNNARLQSLHVLHDDNENDENDDNDEEKDFQSRRQAGDLEVVEVVDDEDAQRWDCETVLSMYSNLDNHPRVIGLPRLRGKPIVLNPKFQAPEEYLRKRPEEQLAPPSVPSGGRGMVAGARGPSGPETIARRRGESQVEKKARKEQVKLARRERRLEKKELREAFRAENARQCRHAAAVGTAKAAIQFP